MPEALRVRQQSRERYVRDLHSVWASRTQVFDPSLWLSREPDAEEKMLMDADIRGAIDHRRRLVAGKQWTLMPRQESGPAADLAVSVGTSCLGKLRRFTMSRALLARAFFHGQRFAKIHSAPFTLTIGDGKTRTWVLPTKLEDQDKRTYRRVSKDGGVTAFWERFDIPKALWSPMGATESIGVIKHTHDDEQASLGYGSALREALAWWWYTKAHIFSESTQAAERFGQGMLIVSVDGLKDAETSLPNADLHQQHLDKWEDMRGRHILVKDKDDTVELMDMAGTGHELLSGLRKELRDTIFTLVLGANLPTSASEGGSYALAEVQENSTEAIVQFDREALEETMSDDLLGFVWYHNHKNLQELGIGDEMPRFNITQEKILDPKERAGVAAQASAIGLPLAQEELYEQFGFRKPEEGEEILAPVAGLGQRDLFGGIDLGQPVSTNQPTSEAGQPLPTEETDHQDTALNGAQVTAAAEIIDRVVNDTMPPSTAVLMLTSMFNLPPAVAKTMVDEAAAFTPAVAPKAEPVPVADAVPTP